MILCYVKKNENQEDKVFLNSKLRIQTLVSHFQSEPKNCFWLTKDFVNMNKETASQNNYIMNEYSIIVGVTKDMLV